MSAGRDVPGGPVPAGDESMTASPRGRRLATWALGQMLATARTIGLDRVLIVCADGNAASARVIERHGGFLEGVRNTALGPVRRYWVALGPRTVPLQSH